MALTPAPFVNFANRYLFFEVAFMTLYLFVVCLKHSVILTKNTIELGTEGFESNGKDTFLL